ncbi:hypothetical protein LV779_15710 [Streptomyces thinghirensis]|nr:hypothetical protein [Streptomyces thinghirensis]
MPLGTGPRGAAPTASGRTTTAGTPVAHAAVRAHTLPSHRTPSAEGGTAGRVAEVYAQAARDFGIEPALVRGPLLRALHSAPAWALMRSP